MAARTCQGEVKEKNYRLNDHGFFPSLFFLLSKYVDNFCREGKLLEVKQILDGYERGTY